MEDVILDDGGQALTEFVIVIPIVLLFFFAMVQYFSIVQATQLENYAAFVAARVRMPVKQRLMTRMPWTLTARRRRRPLRLRLWR